MCNSWREKKMFLYVQMYRSILLKDFINVWNVINMITRKRNVIIIMWYIAIICNDIRIYCLYYKYNLQWLGHRRSSFFIVVFTEKLETYCANAVEIHFNLFKFHSTISRFFPYTKTQNVQETLRKYLLGKFYWHPVYSSDSPSSYYLFHSL